MASPTPESKSTDGSSKAVPIIVVIILLLLGLGVWLFYGSREPTLTEAPPPPAEAPPTSPAASPPPPASPAVPLAMTLSQARVDAQLGKTVRVTAAVTGRGEADLAISGENLPDGAVIESLGPESSQLVWTPQIGQAGVHRLKIVASDGSRRVDQPLTVNVAPPAMAAISDSMTGASVFAFDQFEVTAKNRDRLRVLVNGWRNFSEVSRVTVTGHTDNIGSEAYNMALGMRRAEAVRMELVALGVAESRIDAVSLGESKPIADNATGDGRQRNRRCDVAVEARKAAAP